MANSGSRTYSNSFWIIFGTSKQSTKYWPFHFFYYVELFQKNTRKRWGHLFKIMCFHISAFWKSKTSNLFDTTGHHKLKIKLVPSFVFCCKTDLQWSIQIDVLYFSALYLMTTPYYFVWEHMVLPDLLWFNRNILKQHGNVELVYFRKYSVFLCRIFVGICLETDGRFLRHLHISLVVLMWVWNNEEQY